MVSGWWVAVALLGGAFAGILLMAMLQVAGDSSDQRSMSDLTEMPR